MKKIRTGLKGHLQLTLLRVFYCFGGYHPWENNVRLLNKMDTINNFKAYKEYVKADLFRYTGKRSKKTFIKSYLRIPGFKYMFWFRTVNYFQTKNKMLVPYAKFRLRHFSYKYGIQIPHTTQIDKGFILVIFLVL